jgi:hypothetical protein
MMEDSMIKSTLTTALIFASSAAFAGSLSFDSRFDADTANFNKDAGKSGYTNNICKLGA